MLGPLERVLTPILGTTTFMCSSIAHSEFLMYAFCILLNPKGLNHFDSTGLSYHLPFECFNYFYLFKESCVKPGKITT